MSPTWKNVVLDLETDVVEDDITTKLHCLVLRDVESGAVLSCADRPGYASFAEGIAVLEKAERIYGHNIIKFDRPQTKAHLGHLIPWEKVRDTLTIAGSRWTNLKETDTALVQKGKLPAHLVGKHSLEAWGHRLGVLKGTADGKETKGPGKKKKRGEISDEDRAKWSTWTPEMQAYCEQDTEVTRALVLHIRRSGVSPSAIETEQALCDYLAKQERNGWPFDMEKAIELQGRLAARREELEQELVRVFGSWLKPVKKHGEVVVFTKRQLKKDLGEPQVHFCKLQRVVFNPSSRQQIAERLKKLYGWKPTKFTAGGQPEVSEGTLLALPQDLPGVKLLNEYLLIEKRLGALAEGPNAWLKLATKDRRLGGKLTGMHHVHHVCLQSGTITHRASHIWPNLAQVPKVGIPFGEECRGLFRVPPGWVQVGADASGLELRELAHFMARFDNGAYGRTVTEGRNEDGTDIHSVNRDALGLSGKPGRDAAKTFIYAFLYGSGDLNLGQLLGCSPEEVAGFQRDTKAWLRAKKKLAERQQGTDDYTVACLIKGGTLRARFLKNLPALNSLITEVKKKARESGFLKLHDGRTVPVRHQHAALNSLLQGAGAVVCKRWIVRFDQRLTAEFGPQGWDGKWAALGWIHDEVQLAVRPEIVDRVKEILVEEIRAVAVEFNMRIALDGEAKSGPHWASTH